MKNKSVAFIGGGNMTTAIVRGLLSDGFPASNIAIAEPSAEQRDKLKRALPGVAIVADNDEVISEANSVVLSVKPQLMAMVCRKLAAAVQRTKPLIISIAAGPRIADIDTWLGGENAVVRVMPNQPALLQKGVSGIFANDATSNEQQDTAFQIMSAVGPVIRVANESDIDAVTAISGSGPAYFYLLIDMLAKTAVTLGLDGSAAHRLAVETAVGAAALAQASDDSMDDLIARVRSPGGTTAAALDSLEQSDIRDIFLKALTAARDRATELADQAHEDSEE
ncbi:MAG: pyrroline-5-carboxylate reductase [Woeseiaceae bacterium]|nr:pyrroline-5-carboxylate reductase [Woeseiaceae bacterium]